MPRIRTIKPEFPLSQSMGKVSRDARLFFILLWTQMDDHGRLAGVSRMLSGLLFPSDRDVDEAKIDGWTDELQRQACIIRYTDDEGHIWIASLNWDKHQRIDKPGKSKIPPPDPEKVREILAKVRENYRDSRAILALDQDQEGTRTRNSVKGEVPFTAPASADAQNPLSGKGTARPAILPSSKPAEKIIPPLQGDPDGATPPPRQPSPDDRTWLFNEGLDWLAGVVERSPKAMRSTMGLWLKDCRDSHQLLRVIVEEAAKLSPADPVAWITKAIQTRTERRPTTGPDRELTMAEHEEGRWRNRVGGYKRTGFWQSGFGAKPDEPGCQAPDYILIEFGYPAA